MTAQVIPLFVSGHSPTVRVVRDDGAWTVIFREQAWSYGDRGVACADELAREFDVALLVLP
jgi:hypothetical protein